MHSFSRRFVVGALASLALLIPSLVAGPKIGVLLKGRSAFWSAVEKGALDAGTALGAEVIVKAPLSESDVSVQIQLLGTLGAQGIEALVIAPCNKDALSAPVAALAAKGVKIVVIDSPLDDKLSSVFIATDHQAAGEAAGKLLATLVGDGDEVSVLRHAQGGGATAQREAGALAVLREARPKSPVHADIYASAEKDAEAEKAALLLKTYPQTKAILASGTPGTMAMLRVLQQKKLAAAVKLVGFGFNLNPEVAAALESGDLQGWIAQLPKEIGAKGVGSAVGLLKGDTMAPVIRTEFVVVTRANLKEPAVQALLAL